MLAALTFVGSGCSAPEVGTAASPSASATEATRTQTPSPTSVQSARESNGVPIKGPAQNKNGKYLQTTLNPVDPVVGAFDPKSVTGDAVNTFSADELKEAVRIAEVFIAEEGIDSTLNGSNDPADVDAWWRTNKSRFTPKLQADAYEYVKAGNTLVVRGAWDKANTGNRQYWYDENSSRIQIRENTIKSVDVSSKFPNSVGVDTNLNYIIWGKDEAGKKYPINVKGNFYLNLRKDETTDGKWLIDGQNCNYTGFVSNN